MIDIERELNPSQFSAATTVNGPVLVIAGAGSGKTRVIEYRVLHLVQSGVDPSNLLLLTFTRRAAREMLSRAARHDRRCANVEGGTFHSFANGVLRRYGRSLGLPSSFVILDEAEAEDAIHRCCVRLDVFEKEKRFPRKDTLRAIISMAVNKRIPVVDVLRKHYPHFLEYSDDIETLRRKYAEYKLEADCLDYDDLLVFLRILLLENEHVRDLLAKKYQFVMVDEYQDTNKLQGDITYLLAEKHRNVMIVGDDAQSIYGFRGASHENIMEFPRQFPECKIVKLEDNYRSTQSILDVANGILENMRNKYSKCLVSATKRIGNKPELLFFKNSEEEAEWVAGEIKRFRDEGVALSHQAVLFRAPYISILLQTELTKRNIPYQVFGGLRFYETAHVKDVMAHLKIIANPRHELAWHRLLMLIEGIGPKTADRIAEEILACPSLKDVIERVLKRYSRGYRFSEGIGALRTTLGEAQDRGVGVGTQFESILRYYEPIMRDKFDDWHLRLNDLETLSQISTRYGSLGELLTDFAIEPPQSGVGAVLPSTPEEEKPLTLSTIHSAKGLEWEAVFLIGVVDGILPVGYALGDEDELEEEHRLLYVGVTRAKNNLFLSMHHEGTRGGITRFNKLSRFVDVANVLATLERAEVSGTKAAPETGEPETESVAQIHDKEWLLRRVIDLSG